MADAHSKCCTRCGENKPIEDYPLCRGKPRARCKPCHVADAQAWADKNREAYLHRLRDWVRVNRPPAHMGPPVPPHLAKQRRRAKSKAYQENNKQKVSAWRKRWADDNKHVAMEVVRRRQCAKQKATPDWADRRAMQSFYLEAKRLEAETGIPHDVDHIVPIQSDLVCGLHCEANLQVITRRENRLKHNRWWPDMP